MEKLVGMVKEVVWEEYSRASKIWGQINSSDHESHSIIMEEADEANMSVCSFYDEFQKFWELVKSKNALPTDKIKCLERMENHAMLAAAEYIQVAAMCEKALMTAAYHNTSKE